jgi:hypothetical protein
MHFQFAARVSRLARAKTELGNTTFWRGAACFCIVFAFIQYRNVLLPSGSMIWPACLTATGLSSRA